MRPHPFFAVLVLGSALVLPACGEPAWYAAADRVLETSPERVADCEFMGSVEGTDQGFDGGSLYSAERAARARAAHWGADRIVWYSHSRGRGSVSVLGRAYGCRREATAVAQ